MSKWVFRVNQHTSGQHFKHKLIGCILGALGFLNEAFLKSGWVSL